MNNGRSNEMQYVGSDDMTQVMGIGYLGEVRRGPDGAAYQWVEGIDGLGNPIGFWKKLKRFVKKAMPLARIAAGFIPGGGAAMRAATMVSQGSRMLRGGRQRRRWPILRQVPAFDGLGALYQAPDGTLYQMQGLYDDDLQGFGEEEIQGLGALYQTSDGQLYQVQGLEDDDLQGLYGDEELQGLEEEDISGFEDDELQGIDEEDVAGLEEEEIQGLADDEIQGLYADDELQGLADDEIRGLEEEEIQGMGQGYVRDPVGVNGYVPAAAPGTRWFVPPGQPPELWRPLW
jgi:hypothetical protein